MAVVLRLSQREWGNISSVALEALRKVLEVLREEANGATGGVLQLFYAVDSTQGVQGWQRFFKSNIGTAEEDAFGRRSIVSGHKASTLMVEHALDHRVVSSWQFRERSRWAYGGAFILYADVPELGGRFKILVSFSGLPEIGDEALGMLLVKLMGWKQSLLDDFSTLTRQRREDENALAWSLLLAA